MRDLSMSTVRLILSALFVILGVPVAILGTAPADGAFAAVTTVPGQPVIASTEGDGKALLVTWLPAPVAQEVASFSLTATPVGTTTTAACPNPATKTTTADGTSTAAFITGLCAKIAYTVTMTATNAVGKSAASAVSNPAVPLQAVVPRPPVLNLVVGRNGSALTSWVAPVFDGGSPLTGYVLSAKLADGTVAASASPAATETQATLAGLTNGTPYTLELTAINAVGGSVVSTDIVTPRTTYAPVAPTNLAAVPSGTGDVNVSWGAPPDDGGAAVTSYTVGWQRATADANGVWTPVAGAPLHTTTTFGSVTAVTASASSFESAGAAYLFGVRANNAAGAGARAVTSSGVSPQVVIKSNVVVLNASTTDGLLGVSASSMTWASPSPSQVQGLVVGDVLVANTSPKLLNGTIRKVTAIATSGATVVISTADAAIDDVFSQMAMSADVNPAGAGPAPTGSLITSKASAKFRPSSPGVIAGASTQSEAIGGAFSLGKALAFEHKDGAGYVSAQVEVASKISAALTVNQNWVGVPTGMSVASKATADLIVTAEAGIDGSKDWKLGTIDGVPATFFVGPVPVVIQPKLPIFLTVEGKVVVKAGASGTIGASLAWNSADPWDLTATNESQPFTPIGGPVPGVTATGTGSIGVKLEPIAAFYTAGGPSVSGELDLVADVNLLPAPGQPFLKVSPSLEEKAGVAIDLFGIEGDAEVTLGKQEFPAFTLLTAPKSYTISGPAVVRAGTPATYAATRSDGAAVAKTWSLVGAAKGDTITNSGVFTAVNPEQRTVQIRVTDGSSAGGAKSVFVGQPFDPPGNLSATADPNAHAINVAWSAPANTGGGSIDGYVITTSPATTTANVPATATSTSLTNLASGTYVVSVVARNSLGMTSPSASASLALGSAAEPWKIVSAGDIHTCGVRTGGSLWCWGWNLSGQLGDGTSTDRRVPTRVGTSTDWDQVSAGGYHTCGVRTGGSLWCWGYNGVGALGDGTGVNRATPTRVGTATDWDYVSAGVSHTCALKTGGSLWCWGRNVYGQVGDGTTTNRLGPTQVGSATDWLSMSARDDVTCGIRAGGSLWCWGSNVWGSVGDGTTTAPLLPKRVGTATDWANVAAGITTCGVKTGGSLWCWGANYSGQVGDGTTTNRLVPTQVGSATDWATVSTDDATCGLRTGGSLWCWGSNDSGQVGDGTTTNRIVPTQVGSATDWATVSTGGNHVCGLRTGGWLWCWGYNYSGQLGDGTTTTRLVPTRVTG